MKKWILRQPPFHKRGSPEMHMGGEPTALCRGRADSVMPRQRYAFPALCLAATGGCLPKITTCPRNRKIGWFYNSLVFDTNTKANLKWVPPDKSTYDCKLQSILDFFMGGPPPFSILCCILINKTRELSKSPELVFLGQVVSLGKHPPVAARHNAGKA